MGPESGGGGPEGDDVRAAVQRCVFDVDAEETFDDAADVEEAQAAFGRCLRRRRECGVVEHEGGWSGVWTTTARRVIPICGAARPIPLPKECAARIGCRNAVSSCSCCWTAAGDSTGPADEAQLMTRKPRGCIACDRCHGPVLVISVSFIDATQHGSYRVRFADIGIGSLRPCSQAGRRCGRRNACVASWL